MIKVFHELFEHPLYIGCQIVHYIFLLIHLSEILIRFLFKIEFAARPIANPTDEPWQAPQDPLTLLNSPYPRDLVDNTEESCRDVTTRFRTDPHIRLVQHFI